MTDRREAQSATCGTSRASGRSDRRTAPPRKSRPLAGVGNTRLEPVEGNHPPGESGEVLPPVAIGAWSPGERREG